MTLRTRALALAALLAAFVVSVGLSDDSPAKKPTDKVKQETAAKDKKEGVSHPATVKGETLVELDLEKIDRAIRDLEGEQKMATLTIRQAEEELPLLEKTNPMDLATTERAKKQADEDLKKFVEIDKSMAEQMANNMVRSSSFYVEYAKEELKQLEKMYRNKDLTEETEEIILRRQRHQVEMAEFFLKVNQVRRDQVVNIDLPRQEQNVKDNAAKATLALDRARSSLPLTLSQKKLTLEKLRYDTARSAERLKNLKADRDLMTVKSPADGVVYYGKCVQGQWTTAAAVAQKLQRGGMLMADEVFLTVVSPKPLQVQANVEEKDLHWLHAGLKGKAEPAGYPDVKLPVELTSLSAVPHAAGSFPARMSVDPARVPESLMPGMACTVKFVAYHKDDALTLPAGAVFADDSDEDQRYVYLPAKAGKSEKHKVKVGHTSDGHTEILEGLKEGEEVLSSKP